MRSPRAAIDLLPIFPLIIPQFLQVSERQALLQYVTEHDADFGQYDLKQDYWAGRTLTPNDIRSAEVLKVFRTLRDRVVATLQQHLAEHLGPQPPLYVDLVNFARWPPGYELAPHADSENPGGAEHPYPWRDFASVIYLNDDYEGGEIFFPGHGIELQPQAGALALFPGTLRYLHGVRRVTRGMRQTIASFITYDATRRYEF